MRKRRILLLGSLCFVVVLVALLVIGAFREREPEYGGRKLSWWVLRYSLSGLGAQAERERADEALRHIGTNAIPHLLAWGKYRMSPRTIRFLSAVQKLPLGDRLVWLLGRQWFLFGCLPDAFAALGPQAKGAIPALTLEMNDPKADLNSSWLIHALGRIGPEALPALMAALTNGLVSIRKDVVLSIGNLGTNALPALPFIIQLVADQDEALASIAIRTLGNLKLAPEIVVPALRSCLSDSRPKIQTNAARALQAFGAEARPAVPDLVRLLQSSNIVTRGTVWNALGVIDPEAVRRIGMPPPGGDLLISP